MFRIDRKFFFDSYREAFGPMTQSQVDGLNCLLDRFEQDAKLVDPRWAAYMLATVKRECGDEWRPIREYDRGAGRPYGKQDPETHQTYFGRGYVQLTWRDNYETFGGLLEADLLHNPDLVLDPGIAYRIMSLGMRRGLFTGVGLPKYISKEKCDYVNARKIINGLDCASLIARYAQKFERMFREAA